MRDAAGSAQPADPIVARDRMRRRVRGITGGSIVAATLATVGLTVFLGQAEATTSTSTTTTGSEGSTSSGSITTPSSTSDTATTNAADTTTASADTSEQITATPAPTSSQSSGSHAGSGGS